MDKYVAVVNISYGNNISTVTDWVIKQLYADNIMYGDNIDSLMDTISRITQSAVLYIHDLDFVGITITDYLLHHDYTWASTIYDLDTNTFTGLYNNNNGIYNIVICHNCRYDKNNNKRNVCSEIINSRNLYDVSIEDTRIGCKLGDMSDIDVLSYIITTLDDYGLLVSHNQRGHKTKFLTISQAALYSYKKHVDSMPTLRKSKKKQSIYNYIYPKIESDIYNDIRTAYHGGYLHMEDRFVNKETSNGFVVDNNGLYASVMHDKLLPYGQPVVFEGNYKDLDNYTKQRYPIYLQRIKGQFIKKPNSLETVPLTDKIIDGISRSQYLIDSNSCDASVNGYITLLLTETDLKWLYRNYFNNGINMLPGDDYGMEYLGGYMFRADTQFKLLRPWVDYWCNERIKAEQEGNLGKRKLCKMVINALSGKFASGNTYEYVKPVIDEHWNTLSYEPDTHYVRDKYHQIVMDTETDEKMTETHSEPRTVYLPLAVFITSYGRDTTISLAQEIHSESIEKQGKTAYIYSDTDSVHFELDSIPEYVKIDTHKIGWWKVETAFDRAKYIGLKTYMLHKADGTTKLVCAGLPKDSWGNVDYNSFADGSTYKAQRTIAMIGGAGKVEYNFELRGNVKHSLDILRRRKR